MRLLSISSGKVVPLFGNHHPDYKSVASAIVKTQISNLNNPNLIEITKLGVKGDEQAYLSVHGGLEKAIYVYPAEHYPFWNTLLTRETKKSMIFNPAQWERISRLKACLKRKYLWEISYILVN